jgi:hypothetical protein
MISHNGTGPEFTTATLAAAVAACRKQGIGFLVVASTTGATAEAAADAAAGEDIKLVVVTHNTGFNEPGVQQFPAEVRARLEARGVAVHTGSMVFRSLGRAVRDKTGGDHETLIAGALRTLGEGAKVCAEIAMMAADAGLIPPADVVCVAGTGRGADTAAVIAAAPSHKFFELKIRGFIAKPFDF